MKHRYTVAHLPSDLPSYSRDNATRALVIFEWTPYQNTELGPCYMTEDRVRQWLLGQTHGFTDKGLRDVKWPDSYLEYLKPLDETTGDKIISGGDPNHKGASQWEFRVIHPSTD